MAILRGHHHNDWYHAIKRTYKKRTQPPGTEKKKKPKDKSPLELCATLMRESWRFFEKIWENRTDCPHNPSGESLSRFDKKLNNRLIHYKRTAWPRGQTPALRSLGTVFESPRGKKKHFFFASLRWSYWQY